MTATDLRSGLSGAAVLGIGASSPIGYGVRPMQAAMAGALRNFREGRFTNGDGKPARTSRMPELDEEAPRSERIAALTQWAIEDLVRNLTVELSAGIPVHVGLAGNAPSTDLDTIGLALANGSRGLVNPKTAKFVGYSTGRISFLSAMAAAIASFDGGGSEVALVVATDSRCTEDAVLALMRERRLLTGKDDGTIPGEAAVIALVASPHSRLAGQSRFLVADPAFALDDFETIRHSPQATQGLGRAFRRLREHPGRETIRSSAVIAFETGELFFTRAFATAYLRNAELMPEPLKHELIATSVGDTGAAAAGMALVRADWILHQANNEENERILIYGHADDGRCAAAVATRDR